jgi:hypothetical protein
MNRGTQSRDDRRVSAKGDLHGMEYLEGETPTGV